MAKSKLNYTKTIIEKISIKGVLSDDCKTIIYTDENDVEREISVDECLAPFASSEIDFSMSKKNK